ncbi:basic leucine zipper 19-like isoform X2 [Zingiber officinale]|uniref:basic leucine zipper 19-like isoform X2 n=1 Tax=Zingiber officinale TaxID=94328 RepID=UPI001C4D5A3D|nr:basic leucine zipper 19-like isoform X2 [Zingiber officinale]
MDEGDLDFSNPEVFSGPNGGEDLPSNCSMDSFFDNIFNDSHTCTHTHTCNPPGPDLSHTHTCFHAHTKIVSASPDETAESVEKGTSSKKRSCGNREAVRKYREKKKAHAASLEEEVAQLRAVNQQLMKRLQNQAALEAEVTRLRCLLVDLRGRIDGEIGCFPYQKQVSCLYPDMQGKTFGENGSYSSQDLRVCEIDNLHCIGTPAARSFGCGNGVAKSADHSAKITKIEGARAAKKDHIVDL